MNQVSSHIFSDEQLIAFAFGELNTGESDRVASHVTECAQCHATVASVQGLGTLLREDDSGAVPSATVARAQAIFRQHTSISKPGWFELLRRDPLQRARQLISVSTLATLLLTFALFYSSARLVAPAVQATVPGDALYPVKTTVEDVRVVVALDNSAKVQAQLSIAQARVTEINTLVEQGRYDFLTEATDDYQRHVQQATTTLGQVLRQDPGQVALAQRAEQALARYEVSLAVLQENSPGDVKPQIRQAVIASTAAKSTVQHQLSDIARPSSATPTPLVTPTPNVVVTASSAPALPAATNTSAPSPTVVNSPTAAPASSSNPTSSVSPTASLPSPTKTTIPATSTALPSSTSVAPTGTRPTTMTPAPTPTPGSTATAPAATSAPTKTPPLATTTATPSGATLPMPASALETPTLAPTPASAPSSASQTATPIALTPTPAAATPAIGPTSTLPAMPTSTPSINNSGISPSSTGIPMSDPTSVPSGPSATIAPTGTPAAAVGSTPFAGTPIASSVATLVAPTPIGGGGTSAPSAGSSSTGGTKPLPSTPGPNIGSAASPSTLATGGGATSTSIAPAGAPGTNSGPTVAATSSGANSLPIAPIATVGPPIQAAPTGVPPLKVATPTAGLVTDLVPPGIIILTR